MWEDIDSEETEIPAEPVAEAPIEEEAIEEEVAWTDGQLMRIETECRKTQRAFAYHPIIGVTPLKGDPPHEYQLTYHIRSLTMTESGELHYLEEIPMHLWIPPGFPTQGPIVRPLVDVFHPNMNSDGVYLSQPWDPSDNLINLIVRVGELLAFRTYDPDSVANPIAMEWAVQNNGSLPLDAHSDFSPYNGGEPLVRIQKLGPSTLDQIRRALDDMRVALLSPDSAPSREELREFCRQTRAAASLFLDSDVPDNLREQASECDDWCRELPASAPLWDYIREKRAEATASESAIISMRAAAASFGEWLRKLEALVTLPEAPTPGVAVRLLPLMDKLQPFQMNLPAHGSDFQKWMKETVSLARSMRHKPPEVNVAPEGSLGRRLSTQLQHVLEQVAVARTACKKAIVDNEAMFRRVGPELEALEQIVGWREYVDIYSKARSTEKHLSEWGSAGVQAFYISNESGSFGPFQFEESVELGDTRVAVRSGAKGQIEVYDVSTFELMGKSTTGTASVMLGKTVDFAGHQTNFSLTPRCDELLVQLNFINAQTTELLNRLDKAVYASKNWCGKLTLLLCDSQQQTFLRDSHRKSVHRWRAVMSDLAALSIFKDRLITYNLVQRTCDELPRLLELIADTDAKHKAATDKIAGIMARSARDPETNQHVIPPKAVKTYQDELRNRDAAKQETIRLRGLLKQVLRDLSARISLPKLCGKAEIPKFKLIGAIPEAHVALIEQMSDAAISKRVAELTERVGVELTFNSAATPAKTGAARPAAPGAAAPAGASGPDASKPPPTPPPDVDRDVPTSLSGQGDADENMLG